MQAINFDAVRTSLAEWIDRLPLTNPVKVAELIYKKLAELPFPQLNPAECFQLLEMLRPSTKSVIEVLQRHLSAREYLSAIESSHESAVAISLLTRYASGYAVLLNLTTSRDTIADNTPLAAICLHRAIGYLSKVLLISYQLYMSPPEQIWLRIHKLYLQAEKNSYIATPIAHAANEAATIDEAYKICILLATSNPNQLRASDLSKLFATLLHWARYTSIVSQPSNDVAITFLLDEDAPPSYQVIKPNTTATHFWRGLETKNLLSRITTSIKQHSHVIMDQDDALSPNVLQGVAKAWSHFSDRVMQRSPRKGNIQITLGLASTHVNIGGDKVFTRFEIKAPKKTPEIEVLDKEADDLILPEKTDTDVEIQEEPQSSKYPLYDWQIINISPQGYCLQTSIEHITKLETGEIVGLLQTAPQIQYWRVGTIRWIKQIENKQIQLGIMILGPSAIPVAIQMIRNTVKQHYRALILPEMYNADVANTLIMPALNLTENDILIINYGDHQSRIKLTEPLYLNEKFYQFKYTVIQELSLPSTNANKDDLESIWDYLK